MLDMWKAKCTAIVVKGHGWFPICGLGGSWWLALRRVAASSVNAECTVRRYCHDWSRQEPLRTALEGGKLLTPLEVAVCNSHLFEREGSKSRVRGRGDPETARDADS